MREHSHCHPKNPSIVCHGRADAVRRGAFWWDARIAGYVCSDLPLRKASWRAKYFNMDAGDGEPYRLEICCFCGMDLPLLYPEETHCPDGDDGC